jgi:glutamate racemase
MSGTPGKKAMTQRKAMLVATLGDWVKIQSSMYEMEVPKRAPYIKIKCLPCFDAVKAAERRKAKKEARA